jgi:flagellar biogenesis protein FliO
MSRRALLTAAIAGLLLAGPLHAGNVDPDVQIIPPRRPGALAQRENKPSGTGAMKKASGNGWWTTLGGLVAVIALIYLAAKVVQKSVPAARKSLPPEVVQVLGRKPLDYRHTIHLVRFGSRLLMLGTSQEGVTTLSEINDPVEIDYLAGLCQPSEPATVSRTFQQLFRRFQNPEPAESAADTDSAAVVDREDESETATAPAVLRLQERLQQPAPIDLNGRASPSPEAVA